MKFVSPNTNHHANAIIAIIFQTSSKTITSINPSLPIKSNNFEMGKKIENKSSTIVNTESYTFYPRYKKTIMGGPLEEERDEPSICSESELDAFGESMRSFSEPKHHRKSVSFGDLLIRTHQVVLGEHPFCQSGCPLELGWAHDEGKIVSVDEFELQRGPSKPRSELRTTRQERREILLKTTSERDLKIHDRKLRRNSRNADDLQAFFNNSSYSSSCEIC